MRFVALPRLLCAVAIMANAAVPAPASKSPEKAPRAPEAAWTPAELPPPAAPPPSEVVGVPDDLAERLDRLTLVDAIDIALRNSPTTRRTWAAARSAAAEIGKAAADFYPEVDVSADLAHVKQSAVGGQFSFEQTVYGPAAKLSWMLLDFGGRRAGIETTRHALEVADWTHNQAIQDVVFTVQMAFYSYLSAEAQLDATAATVEEAETNLQAANDRHDAGVATIADVLQARTALSQAQLAQLVADGQIRVLAGNVATALGLPANTAIDIATRPVEAPLTEIGETVEELIERALASRPDLLADRARVWEAQSKIDSVRSERWPTLDLSGAIDRTYYGGDAVSQYSDNWSASLALTWKVFDGARRRYAIRQAEEDRAVALAETETSEQRVILEVWRSYQDVLTSASRVKTSRDLLTSAEQNNSVALGRYREGVGSILDLLTAQALLASARAQVISASTDWYMAVARLAYATGTTGPEPTGARAPGKGP